MKLTDYKGYVSLWVATTVSNLGSSITALALQVMVVVLLRGNATDVGWISTARLLPYVLLGLIAGATVDRVNRKLVIVLADISRGLLLSAICLLEVSGILNMPILMSLMVLFGAMSLFHDAAYQSTVPQLVPRELLMRANARLEQSSAVTQTSGSAVAGTIISLVGAPFAILIEALSFVLSGAVMASVTYSPSQDRSQERLIDQIKQGVRWVYRHRTLSSLALNTHAWFLFNSIVGTVFVTFALTQLGFTAFTYSLVITLTGVGSLLGSTISSRIGQRWGIGRGMAVSRFLYCPAAIMLTVAPSAHHGSLLAQTFVLVGCGQFLYGLALGIEGPIEMGYQQAVTPSHMQGRMRATMRTINRSMVVVGAPFGGIIAATYGYRLALWIAVVGLATVGAWFFFSPMRDAEIDKDLTDMV